MESTKSIYQEYLIFRWSSSKKLQILLIDSDLDSLIKTFPDFELQDRLSLYQSAEAGLFQSAGIVMNDLSYISDLKVYDDFNEYTNKLYISNLCLGNDLTIYSSKSSRSPQFYDLDVLPAMEMQSMQLLVYGLDKLKDLLKYTTAASLILANEFSLGEMQKLYEATFDRQLDKRNFRKKIMLLDILKKTDHQSVSVPRPVNIYGFKKPGTFKLATPIV